MDRREVAMEKQSARGVSDTQPPIELESLAWVDCKV